MLTAGLGANGVLASVRYWTRTGSPESLQQQTGLKSEDAPKWKVLRMIGDRRMLVKGRSYHLEIKVRGAYAVVELDGVEMASANLANRLACSVKANRTSTFITSASRQPNRWSLWSCSSSLQSTRNYSTT
jgi:hypothetical protein